MAQKYHFTGIGGVGMAGVAFLLKKAGYDVSGCDLHPSPRTRWLEANGIPVAFGHAPSHITPDLDICVFTPAVPKDNAEFKAAEAAPCRVRYRGEVLADIFNAVPDGIAVCGTHGKTTTATFIAKLLRALGDDPGWCIGGETDDFPVAGLPTPNSQPSLSTVSGAWCLVPGASCEAHAPSTKHQAPSTPFIIEADESDGTLALYRAKTLVVTSLDYDHPDHFRTYDDYLACYKTAMAAANDVIESSKLPTDDWPEIRPLVLGEHNVRNARTAVEVALRRGHSREAILAALPEALAALPDRRFERIWPPSHPRLPQTQNSKLQAPSSKLQAPSSKLQTNILTDYAHHPAEIACALSMARALKPKRLRVMFQPHRYSRTKTLLNEFPPAFAEADEVVLVPVYPAFEAPILGGDIADLYLAFRNSQPATQNSKLQTPNSKLKTLLLARSAEEAWKHLYLTLEPGDLVMLLGAGDLINLVPRILEEMDTEPGTRNPKPETPLAPLSFFRTGGVTYGQVIQGDQPETLNSQLSTLNPQPSTLNPQPSTLNPQLKTIIVGMGSNTWFSDCATDADILKAPEGCSAARPGASLLTDHPELAFMAGIPGTIGGWAKMNAGAFGDSFGNHIDYVIADGRKIPAAECGFGYRTSTIPGLITEVILKPAARDPQPATTDYQLSTTDYLARRKKFPPRTCGSVFKNPSPEQPAGKLLEEVGAKSLRVGGASVWSEHANVIVAGDGCTSSDILALARLMAARVRDRFGISLVPEIRGLEV